MGTTLEPVHQARLGVLDEVALSRQRPVRCALIHDQLHVFDTAVEVGVEVAGQCRERYLIVLVGAFAPIHDVERVTEDALRGEKPMNEFNPVRHIVLPFRTLPRRALAVRYRIWQLPKKKKKKKKKKKEKVTHRKAAKMFSKLHQLEQAVPLHAFALLLLLLEHGGGYGGLLGLGLDGQRIWLGTVMRGCLRLPLRMLSNLLRGVCLAWRRGSRSRARRRSRLAGLLLWCLRLRLPLLLRLSLLGLRLRLLLGSSSLSLVSSLGLHGRC